MIDYQSIPAQSDLLDEALQTQLQAALQDITAPVTIKAIVDLSKHKDIEMAGLLRVIDSLCGKITVQLFAPEQAEQAPELDARWLPVTGFYTEQGFARVAFHGVPGGKEFSSFVSALQHCGGKKISFPFGMQRKIDKLQGPHNLKICVSLACHHCPVVVAACQQIALQNPNITAEMIDATLYQDLVQRYQIERIPMIILDEEKTLLGRKELSEIVAFLSN